MLCPRHHAIARTVDDHGWPLCYRCFREAREHAEDIELEDKIRLLRTSSVESLLARLRWR